MLMVEGDNLYDGWIKLNEAYMNAMPEEGMYMSSRDFTRVFSPIRIHTLGGFGFDLDTRDSTLPPFYSKYENRVNLLDKRYIDEELWETALARLILREKKMTRTNPLSFVFPFHRRATNERKVPAGGGCLTQFTFVWYEERWQLHVTLRASEITVALAGDIAFVHHLVQRVKNRVRFRNWDDDKLEIFWDMSLGSQMKVVIPLFLLYTRGDLEVLDLMYKDPRKIENKWFADIVTHFWDIFIHPERVTWHRRLRWTRQFLGATQVDWQKAYERWQTECDSTKISPKL